MYVLAGHAHMGCPTLVPCVTQVGHPMKYSLYGLHMNLSRAGPHGFPQMGPYGLPQVGPYELPHMGPDGSPHLGPT